MKTHLAARWACWVLVPWVAFAAPDVLDADVLSSTGMATRLSTFWGKPTLLFYEHPSSLEINREARVELTRLGEAYQLQDVVLTLAVIDLEGLDWWPARELALSNLRTEEQKVHVPVLADVTGALRKGPWKLNGRASTVLVLSPRGELLFRASGHLEGATLEALKATLRGLLVATTIAR